MTHALKRAALVLGALALLAACGAAGAPSVDGGVDLSEFWRR